MLSSKDAICLPIISDAPVPSPVDLPKPPRKEHAALSWGWSEPSRVPRQRVEATAAVNVASKAVASTQSGEIDPFYLFARHMEWESDEEPSAGWELLAAARSTHEDTRAHARALLASSHLLAAMGSISGYAAKKHSIAEEEMEMNAPYGLEICDRCSECTMADSSFFCGLSPDALESLNAVSQRTVLPAGAILFVEGQTPRGMFILCSGTVNLSTSSREGKTLILKAAEAGEALGLSAAVSGSGYEVTAETATPSLINFIERKDFLELMRNHSEVGLHTAQSLSRDFRAAYRDIHDLVLTRSSAGKLARLLLSQSSKEDLETFEIRIPASMTHMGQRIGASRETVTRLLSILKKKQLIRSDGPTLVIRDRSGLEALAI